jgi:GT2 family glycosyltransferase
MTGVTVEDRPEHAARLGAPCPFVRVVVLNFNGGEHVVQCVDHLLRTDWPADRFEVVVVDNDSTDGSDVAVAEAFDSVTLIRTGANLGFSAGNNAALRDLHGVDHVALVNNDAFVEPGWLAPLVAALEADPGLGAACPKILFLPAFREVVIESPTFAPFGDDRALGVQLHEVSTDGQSVNRLSQFVAGAWAPEPRPDGGSFRWLGERAVLRVAFLEEDEGIDKVAFAEVVLAAERDKHVVITSGRYRLRAAVGPTPRAIRVPVWGPPFHVVNNAGSVLIDDGFGADRGFLAVDDGRFDEPTDVFSWCGGGVLLRRSYLEHVGLLDERFFLYYEDTDLAWRGQVEGWRYRYVPTSVIRHLHAASSGGEGSDLFHYFVERNRLLMLTKNAPAPLVRAAVLGYLTATASYARRDVLPPVLRGRRPPTRLVRNRLRSFASYCKWAPAMLADRRTLARRRRTTDAALAHRWWPRAAWTAAEVAVREGAGQLAMAPWGASEGRASSVDGAEEVA